MMATKQTGSTRIHRPQRPAVRVAIAVAVAVAALLVVVAGVRVVYSGKVLPRTSAGGTAIGGQDAEQARRLVAYQNREPVTISAGGRRARTTPEQAGWVLDPAKTAKRAMDAGRDGPLFGVFDTVRTLVLGRDVEPVRTFDAERFDRRLDTILETLGTTSVPGAIVIDPNPDDLFVRTEPPKAGRTVDRDALARGLRAALRQGDKQIRLPLTTQRAPSQADVQRVADQAERLLEQPLRLTGAGRTYVVDPARTAALLELQQDPEDPTKVHLGAKEEELEKLLATVAQARDTPAREPAPSVTASRSITFDAKGDATWRPRRVSGVRLRPGRSGRVVQVGPSAESIGEAIRRGERSARLVTKRRDPTVSVREAAKANRLIGTFTTYYVPNEPRVRNIRTIARAVDGVVIPPGGQFSLNAISGERTLAKGYVEAPFIADNKIVPSVGGGVSQFSTTMYNAAYFAGLRIDGHRPHSLYIGRYPAGREATLNFGTIDLTWTNDTDAPVLVRTVSGETSVSVYLYGNNGGRVVSAQSGERTPVDGGDFSITVTRRIVHPDGRETEEPYTTRYEKERPADETATESDPLEADPSQTPVPTASPSPAPSDSGE